MNVQPTKLYQDTNTLIKDFALGNPTGQAVCVIGETGAGKSTLVNLIAGAKLCVKYDPATDTTSIDANPPIPGFEIGNSLQSQTCVPHAWIMKDGPAFIDFPGFSSNRGFAQEIADALSMKKVIEGCLKTKVIIMTSDKDLMEDPRAIKMKGLADQLGRLFAEKMDLLERSSMVVVSHALPTRTEQQVRAKLERVIQEVPADARSKAILGYFSKNPICIFKIPAQDGSGLLSKEVVFSQVNTLPYTEGAKVCLAASQGCNAAIVETYNALHKDSDQTIGAFFDGFIACIQTFANGAAERKDKTGLNALLASLHNASQGEYLSIQALRQKVTLCGEISTKYGQNLASEKLTNVYSQLEIKNFFEQFIPANARLILESASSIPARIKDATVIVERALTAIAAQEEQERAAEAARQAEAARRTADEEQARRVAEEERARQAAAPAPAPQAQPPPQPHQGHSLGWHVRHLKF